MSIEGRIGRITLQRPEKRNALNGELCRTILSAREMDVNAIVLTAEGPVFCAGMDLKDTDHAELHEQLFTLIDTLRKPLIAAIRGGAYGGGVGLAANAHIAIAAPDAKFALPELALGIWPMLIFRSIALAMGERRATELSLTGRTFTALEAQQYGLVTEIAENPEERAMELARLIAGRKPEAVAAGLDYAHRSRRMDWTEAGKLGAEMRSKLLEGFTR